MEIAEFGSGVALRDSTHPDGARLRFSNADWTAFLADLRLGRLDHHHQDQR